jgi:hypothetical protein
MHMGMIKEIHGETQQTINVDGFLSFTPHWMLMYIFASFLKISPNVWSEQTIFSILWCI